MPASGARLSTRYHVEILTEGGGANWLLAGLLVRSVRAGLYGLVGWRPKFVKNLLIELILRWEHGLCSCPGAICTACGAEPQ